jgi:hypothetical protein
MGFRCPNCKEDFGESEKILFEHFNKHETCFVEAYRLFAEKFTDSFYKVKELEKEVKQ